MANTETRRPGCAAKSGQRRLFVGRAHTISTGYAGRYGGAPAEPHMDEEVATGGGLK